MAETQRLIRLRADGRTVAEMAKALGRTKNSVRHRVGYIQSKIRPWTTAEDEIVRAQMRGDISWRETISSLRRGAQAIVSRRRHLAGQIAAQLTMARPKVEYPTSGRMESPESMAEASDELRRRVVA
ncbi:MAG: hypothetical protein WDA25_11260, partial [Paracoccaceae bacterium]